MYKLHKLFLSELKLPLTLNPLPVSLKAKIEKKIYYKMFAFSKTHLTLNFCQAITLKIILFTDGSGYLTFLPKYIMLTASFPVTCNTHLNPHVAYQLTSSPYPHLADDTNTIKQPPKTAT